MANKKISQLPAASALQNSDLLVAEQNGVAKSVTGTVLLAMLDGHGGIANTSYTPPVAPSLQGTLTLTFTDGTSTSIPVYNGAQGAQGGQGEQGERGAAFTYEDFTPEQLESLRGEQGIQGVPGNPGYVHIKWASANPTSDADIGDIPDAWMGIYSGSSSTAPTAYTSYAWYNIKGATGATGAAGANGDRGTYIWLSNSPAFLDDNDIMWMSSSALVVQAENPTATPRRGDFVFYEDKYYLFTGTTSANPLRYQVTAETNLDPDRSVVWVTYGTNNVENEIEPVWEEKPVFLTYNGDVYRLSQHTVSNQGTTFQYSFVGDPVGYTGYVSLVTIGYLKSPSIPNGVWAQNHLQMLSRDQLRTDAGQYLKIGSDGNVTHGIPSASDVGAIAAPASPANGDVLTYDGTAWIASAGGGGGVTDYSALTNKPSINSVTLNGNKTASDLGMIAAPSSPATGAFLVWNGTAWTAQTLSTWNGGSY